MNAGAGPCLSRSRVASVETISTNFVDILIGPIHIHRVVSVSLAANKEDDDDLRKD
jgi:hypothetical protein